MDVITQESEKKSTKKTSKTTKSKTSKVKTEDVEEAVVVEENLSKVEDLKIDEHEQNNITEDVESESHDTEENQNSSLSEDECLNKLNVTVESLTSIKKIDFKDFELTKDFITDFNKKLTNVDKLLMNIRHSFTDLMVKENSISLKKNSKKNKVKTASNQNAGVNKKKSTYSEVLKFLKFEDNKEVSRAEILQGINNFVKEQKTNKNPDIFVEGDNTKFVLIGDLKILFDFIKKQMIERGDLKKEDEDNFPKFLAYRDIMKYSKYCFPESQK